jgi:hypothetical protein
LDLAPLYMVLVAVDRTRNAVEAMFQRDAIGMIEAAVVSGAHVPFRAANAHFTAFKAACLACLEAPAVNALRYPVLLEVASLVDGGGMALRRRRSRCRCSLAKANG